jgi:hypothetical protein
MDMNEFTKYVMGDFICWFKGRKINHIISDPTDEKTLCGLRRNHQRGVSRLSTFTCNICKRCDRIYKSAK